MPNKPWMLSTMCGTANVRQESFYQHASKSPTSSKKAKEVHSGPTNPKNYNQPPYGSSDEVQYGGYSKFAPSNGLEGGSVVPQRPGALMLPPTESYQENQGNQPASSSHDHRNGKREDDIYLNQAPPPGSYQDDDTGPSPKNLLMAVTGVKSSVTYFAKMLMSDKKGHEELKRLMDRDGNAQVERANHSKFLVQAFLCKRFFEGFDREGGFYGIERFQGHTMSSPFSFADFTKYKDKANTISGLLSNNHEDISFLGLFCFKKFKSICGDAVTDQPFSIYRDDWETVSKRLHPKSEFYRSYLKVAVSVWLLHRLAHSFAKHDWKMLTYSRGHAFDRKFMESVVPGGYEEEAEDGDVNLSVGFSVIPGFKVSRSIVKCEVYVHNRRNDGKTMETPDKTSGDKIPVTQKTQESVRTSGDRNRVQDTAVVVQGDYWNRPGVRSLLPLTGNLNSGGSSRKILEYSPGSREHAERNDHAAMSTHFFPKEQSYTKEPRYPIDRPTALTTIRGLENKKKKTNKQKSSPNGGPLPNRSYS